MLPRDLKWFMPKKEHACSHVGFYTTEPSREDEGSLQEEQSGGVEET
jgi:hypothetical protein